MMARTPKRDEDRTRLVEMTGARIRQVREERKERQDEFARNYATPDEWLV